MCNFFYSFRNIEFVHNLIGIYIHIFTNMTSLLWRHVYIERSQLVQYFTHSFNTCQVLNVVASYEYQKMNAFSNETCLNVNINLLFFNILSKFIWNLIDTRRSDRMRDATAAIAGSVAETTHRPGLFSLTTLTRQQANFLHQTCIAGLVKHLSPYTGRISRVNGIWATSFCPEKINNRTLFLTGCFQR